MSPYVPYIERMGFVCHIRYSNALKKNRPCHSAEEEEATDRKTHPVLSLLRWLQKIPPYSRTSVGCHSDLGLAVLMLAISAGLQKKVEMGGGNGEAPDAVRRDPATFLEDVLFCCRKEGRGGAVIMTAVPPSIGPKKMTHLALKKEKTGRRGRGGPEQTNKKRISRPGWPETDSIP